MEETIKRFPLQWPLGYKRTLSFNRIGSRFNQTPDNAQRSLHLELERIDASNIVVSTNIRFRKDNMLYAAEMSKKIQDPGVAVYFVRKNKQLVLCADQYETIWENIYAIAKTLEAFRGVERWGVSEVLERTFSGFGELPPSFNMPAEKPWYEVFDFRSIPGSIEPIKVEYRRLARLFHEDGTMPDHNKMTEVNIAYEQAKKHFGIK